MIRLSPCLLHSIHSGCLNQHQHDEIDWHHEENRLLRLELGNKRLHLNDELPPQVCDRVDIQLLLEYGSRYGLSATHIRAPEPPVSY
jgi:hypothetical protein